MAPSRSMDLRAGAPALRIADGPLPDRVVAAHAVDPGIERTVGRTLRTLDAAPVALCRASATIEHRPHGRRRLGFSPGGANRVRVPGCLTGPMAHPRGHSASGDIGPARKVMRLIDLY